MRAKQALLVIVLFVSSGVMFINSSADAQLFRRRCCPSSCCPSPCWQNQACCDYSTPCPCQCCDTNIDWCPNSECSWESDGNVYHLAKPCPLGCYCPVPIQNDNPTKCATIPAPSHSWSTLSSFDLYIELGDKTFEASTNRIWFDYDNSAKYSGYTFYVYPDRESPNKRNKKDASWEISEIAYDEAGGEAAIEGMPMVANDHQAGEQSHPITFGTDSASNATVELKKNNEAIIRFKSWKFKVKRLKD